MKKIKIKDIFLELMSVLTLIVAIIGATFAYFSATVMSENEINLKAVELSLGYTENLNGIKTKLIPASNEIALYAATNYDWINKQEITHNTEQGETFTTTGKGECFDEYMNEVCGVYEFTFGNSSLTTDIDITAKITVSINQTKNLWFAVYDETNTQVIEPTKFPTETGGEVILSGINQHLLASRLDDKNNEFDPDDPKTYTPIVDKTNPDNKDKETNVRTYRLIMWVKETGVDQTKDDAGKVFIGSVTIDTANGGLVGTFTASKK